MSSYINFSVSRHSAGYEHEHAVTLAYPENGQDVTTEAVGEEGGYTTLAVGEEGGYTTRAIGEEGGIMPPNDQTSKRTQDYIDFLREADFRGAYSHGYGYNYPDGRLTRQEAAAQIDVYRRQINYLDRWCEGLSWHNPYVSNYFCQIKDYLQDKLRVGQRLLNNFSTFARGGFSSRPGDDPYTVSLQDIKRLSNRDGNPYNISDFDLGIVYFDY